MDMPKLIDLVNIHGGRFALVGAKSRDSPDFHVELYQPDFDHLERGERRYCYPIANFGEEFKEFSVLQKIRSSKLLPIILDPKFKPRDPNVDPEYDLDDSDYKPAYRKNKFAAVDEQWRDLNKDNFNRSQVMILKEVQNMPADTFLLVQGPPGTGKTSTICGMLSFILNRNEPNKKVHLCAPSNGAVDQILQKVLEIGLPGMNADECKKVIARVGASNYRAPEELACIDLGWQIQQAANLDEVFKIRTVELRPLEAMNLDEKLKE
jgi:hypothetical protein